MIDNIEELFKKWKCNWTLEDIDENHWLGISIHEKLTENFIRTYQDKLDWGYISKKQKLSEDFIREFKDNVDWESISQYQDISKSFRRSFRIRLSKVKSKSKIKKK